MWCWLWGTDTSQDQTVGPLVNVKCIRKEEKNRQIILEPFFSLCLFCCGFLSSVRPRSWWNGGVCVIACRLSTACASAVVSMDYVRKACSLHCSVLWLDMLHNTFQFAVVALQLLSFGDTPVVQCLITTLWKVLSGVRCSTLPLGYMKRKLLSPELNANLPSVPNNAFSIAIHIGLNTIQC